MAPTLPSLAGALARAAPALAASLLCALAPAQRHDEQQQQQQADAALERVVFRAFPEADGYKCISRDVGLADRRRIEDRLPFKVHFDELGAHKLTVAFRGRRPVGLVYRRNEEADWGLTEIAWHLTLDLRVVDFKFLRGRNRHIRALEQSRLAQRMGNRDLGGIIELIQEHERADHGGRDASLVSLERTALRSAAKALVVTETVWSREVEKLHDQAAGFDLFPAAARFTRRTTTLDLAHGGRAHVVDVKILYAYDLGNTLLGSVVWSFSTDGEEQTALRWVVDRDLRVADVVPTRNVRDVELRKDCSRLKGHALAEPPAGLTELGPLARSVDVAIRAQMDRRAR